jgi:hypothetical protein
MNTILKILAVSIVIALFSTTAQARNEYLNDGTNSCDQGSWEAYTEVRQHEYKSGNNDESQNQTLGFRFRKSIGPVCDEEFAEEQRLKQKLKTQLEFAELINMCSKLGLVSAASFEDRPDDSISYWTVLKDGWKKENPDRPVFEGQ